MAMIKGGDRILDNRNYSKWFFGLALALGISYLWVLGDEFWTRRTYIHYQKDFQQYELGKVEAEKAKALEEFQAQGGPEEIAQLRSQIEDGKARIDTKIVAQVEDELTQKDSEYDYWNRKYKGAKSEQDGIFYLWKHAVHEGREGDGAGADSHGKVAEKEAHYFEWEEKLEEFAAKRDKTEKERNELQEKLKKLMVLAELETQLEDRESVIGAYDRQIVAIKKRNTREIKQIVNDRLGVGGEYSFGTVDRCQSCHVAIDRPGFEVDEQGEPRGVFRSHPRMSSIFGAHPMDEYGCTVCHHGDGRATRFRPANVWLPWKKSTVNLFVDHKDQAHGLDHYWPLELLRGDTLEASCHKCHSTQRWLHWGFKEDDETGRLVADQAAPAYEKGKDLFIEKGCHGCHLVEGYGKLARVGPELFGVRGKNRPEWLVNWIMNPKEFRSDTRMPEFSFDPGKIEPGPEEQRKAAIEIAAYLWQQSSPVASLAFGPYPGGGNPQKGREVIETVGCLACHTVDDGQGGRMGVLNASRLEDVGAKVATADWIYNWIQDPTWHSKTTRMPDFRLTRGEARDVTAYLWKSRTKAPEPDLALRKQLEDPILAKAGQRLIPKIGCAGCHLIEKFENASRIAPELTNFAEKATYELAFGDSGVEEDWEAWTRGKLVNPRQYVDERSSARMPDFHLADDEIDALMVFLSGMRRPLVPADMKKQFIGLAGAIERGRDLVTRYNCVGCHQIEGRGGDILDVVDDDPYRSPPNLKGEGVKITSGFLNEFLRGPTPIRRWLKIRMPTFNLNDEQISDIIRYFRALDGIENPYDHINLASATPASIARGSQLFSSYRCTQCHLFRGQTPPGTLGPNWGPDLARLPSRMRPEGVRQWLKAPQKMMPGTAMPGFFYNWDRSTGEFTPLQDGADQKVEDIVNFLFAGPHTRRSAQKSEKKATPRWATLQP